MVHLEAELDRLAADLAVLNVACGAGTGVKLRLEALAAIRAIDPVKLQAGWGAAVVRGGAGVDDRRKAVLQINTLRIAWVNARFGCLLAGNGPFHRLTIRPRRR